ncbi:hypothetical protein Cantr_01812 [Candida viswanathii]|uniref:F-box domain-containing protein n=1 Tax=Candida viswanathii TaxID=5486 RepID=A0A367YJI5_9ASCO|nr:hypothetical protein Cantr_01812 [Candida viswanathii]
MKVSELPEEVLQMIFSCVPSSTLVSLLDVPEIERYVILELYSTIRISGTRHGGRYKPLMRDGVPMLRNAYAYLALLEAHPWFRPRQLVVVFSGVQSTEKYAALLAGLFNQSSLKGKLRIDLRQIEGEMDLDLAMFAKSMTLYQGCYVPLVDEARCPNLTSLAVKTFLNEGDISRLPQTLVSLELKLMLQVQLFDVEKVLRFPESLRMLDIKEIHSDTREALHLDVSHLQNLVKLSTDPSVVCHWRFPKSLRVLTTHWSDIIPKGLSTMCPDLKEVVVLNSRCESVNFARWLPPGLKELTIPANAFGVREPKLKYEVSNPWKRFKSMFYKPSPDDNPNQTELPFAANLRTLKIHSTSKEHKPSIASFQGINLPNLVELSICGSRKIRILGDIPRNITKLSVSNIAEFDFNELQHLQNLITLHLSNILGQDSFYCDLPNTLQEVAISACSFGAIRINAPNLGVFKISRSPLEELNGSNFVLPDTLKELHIHDTLITRVTANLPVNLQSLDLSRNDLLESVDQPPVNLKHILLAHTSLGSTTSPFDFPPGFETLDLSGTRINADWIRRLRLLLCVLLKELAMRDTTEILNLDTSCLPCSLIVLDLTSTCLDSITGDFQQFPHLESIGLSGNDLCGCFAGSDGAWFGDGIKFVEVMNCGLSKPDVDVLYDELIQKPRFEHLLVDDGLLPCQEELELRKRKLGNFTSEFSYSNDINYALEHAYKL